MIVGANSNYLLILEIWGNSIHPSHFTQEVHISQSEITSPSSFTLSGD